MGVFFQRTQLCLGQLEEHASGACGCTVRLLRALPSCVVIGRCCFLVFAGVFNVSCPFSR